MEAWLILFRFIPLFLLSQIKSLGAEIKTKAFALFRSKSDKTFEAFFWHFEDVGMNSLKTGKNSAVEIVTGWDSPRII